MIPFSINAIREQFPILKTPGLVYLDNASTTQKPLRVIDAIHDFYTNKNANVHRGVYPLSEHATQAYEKARQAIAVYIKASKKEEIVFTKGTTEGINLIAQSWGSHHLRPGDEIILTMMEHHSNIVPWQQIANAKQAIIRVVPLKGWDLDLEAFKKLLGPKTKLVACTHISNTLGTINPIKEIVSMAKSVGAITVVDGAQAVPHMRVDVQDLGCDFYVFSGHKLFGPTGIGVIYGRSEAWKDLPPYQGGGNMIQKVSFEKTTYKDYPDRFEAGTPHIEGVLGLHAAIEFMESIDLEEAKRHENKLLDVATEELGKIQSVSIIGQSDQKACVLSFSIEGVHPHDVAEVLARHSVAIRAGHHCNQPLMHSLGIPGTNRASFAFYNTLDEVSILVQGIKDTLRLFR